MFKPKWQSVNKREAEAGKIAGASRQKNTEFGQVHFSNTGQSSMFFTSSAVMYYDILQQPTSFTSTVHARATSITAT